MRYQVPIFPALFSRIPGRGGFVAGDVFLAYSAIAARLGEDGLVQSREHPDVSTPSRLAACAVRYDGPLA